MSDDQRALLDHPARFVFVGAGTKTGKTVADAIWANEGLLQGMRVAWIGPWYKRTKLGYEHIKGFLRDWEKAGFARCRDADMSIDVYKTTTGRVGHLECFSGDNPDSVYGEAFDRVIIDEATRMPEATFHSARSTVTATGGSMRITFNTDRGARHWAIREFFRAKRGEEASYGYVTMPTAASPYVHPDDIAQAKRILPDRVFRALYLAEVSEDDASVFGDPRRCVSGHLEEPRVGATYVMGVDLARRHDYTVLTVMDRFRRHVVAWDRFHGQPWRIQREKIQALARRYNYAKVLVDATGLGDPNLEELVRSGVRAEGYVLSGSSKRDLIERLVVAVENRQITYPNLPTLLSEMDVYEYETSASGNIAYGAPDGFNDDAVVSLALANYGCGPASLHVAGLTGRITTDTGWGGEGSLACL